MHEIYTHGDGFNDELSQAAENVWRDSKWCGCGLCHIWAWDKTDRLVSKEECRNNRIKLDQSPNWDELSKTARDRRIANGDD